MICKDEQIRWIKQKEGENASTAQPKAKHADLGRKPYRVQQSQDNTSPEWQELLFASVEVINDGSLPGSGSRWALSPWLPVPVSSLQAALANACTSAMSRHECQPGMWWHSKIPWQTTQHGGKRAEIREKQEEKTFRIKGRKKEKRMAWKLVSVILMTAYIMPRVIRAFGFMKAVKESATVITLSLSRTAEDRRSCGR